MGQTVLNFRIDEETKRDFDKFCSTIGMNTTVALTIFMRTVVREQRIPFEISLIVPNDEVKNAIEDAENKKDVKGSFDSVDALMSDLNDKD